MVSFWQRIFNIFVVIVLLYFFWVTANMYAFMIMQSDINGFVEKTLNILLK